MAEYSAVLEQTVNPGQSIIFTASPVPCNRGFIMHRDENGTFKLSGYIPNRNRCSCGCHPQSALYLCSFGANVAIPEGGTLGEIQVAITVGNSSDASSIMISNPAAVNQYDNISRTTHIPVWRGCCEDVAVTNIGTEPILVQNATIVFSRPDLVMSY